MDEHLTSKQPWGDIDLNFTRGVVFFQQRWFYDWRLWTGVTAPWTLAEKRAFHSRVDHSIWRVWSNRVRLRVAGNSPFVRRFSGRGVLINFDVQWVLTATQHWTVRAFKVPPGSTPTNPHRSRVIVATRTIELNTADVRPRGAGNAAGASRSDFETPPHELAHTMDNPDEYNATSPHIGDTDSLVNIGKQIRGRHIRWIIDELNKMIPNCTFSY